MSASVAKLAILAVIQAPDGDDFIGNQALHLVLGHPLLAWTICAARDAHLVSHVVVVTNNALIAQTAKDYGADCLFPFPEELSWQRIKTTETLNRAIQEWEQIKQLRFDAVVELSLLTPLRDGADVDRALEKLMQPSVEAVVSVSEFSPPPEPITLSADGGQIISHQATSYHSVQGDSPQKYFAPNGAILAMRRNLIVEQHQCFGHNPHVVVLSPLRSVAVRSVGEIPWVESLLRDGHSGNRPAKKEMVTIERHIQGGRPLVLVTVNMSFLPKMRAEIAQVVDCIFAYGADRQTIVEILPHVDAWLCSPVPPYLMDGALLELAPRLKIVATPSTGSNHIDRIWCQQKGLEVACLKDTAVVNSIYASSEFTWGLIMTVVRRIHMAIARVRQNYWRDVENELRTVEFHGKTMGIIGYGRIGGNIARYAHAFRMNIIAYDPYKTIQETYVQQATSAMAVLQQADCLLISVHLDDTTRGMVTEGWYAAMKPGAIFINISRGEIIDEAALLRYLSNGHLSGAALDVISDEYLSDKRQHPVLCYARSHENLVVTPHIAGLTVDSEYKAAKFAFDAILRTLKLGNDPS
ncbi:MAG: cytidylyltransferase [Nitrospirae bacterium]|nr:cytidylyltransferase [Magnetococcales bacterium]